MPATRRAAGSSTRPLHRLPFDRREPRRPCAPRRVRPQGGRREGLRLFARVEIFPVDLEREDLDHWLTDPEAAIPGQKMSFSVSDAADRADIIAYLRTAK